MAFWDRNKQPFTRKLSNGSVVTLRRPKTSDLQAAQLAAIQRGAELRSQSKAALDADTVKRMEESAQRQEHPDVTLKERERWRRLSDEERARQAREDRFSGIEPATLVCRCMDRWVDTDGAEMPDAMRQSPDELRDNVDEKLLDEVVVELRDAWENGVREREEEHRKNSSASARSSSTGKTDTGRSR